MTDIKYRYTIKIEMDGQPKWEIPAVEFVLMGVLPGLLVNGVLEPSPTGGSMLGRLSAGEEGSLPSIRQLGLYMEGVRQALWAKDLDAGTRDFVEDMLVPKSPMTLFDREFVLDMEKDFRKESDEIWKSQEMVTEGRTRGDEVADVLRLIELVKKAYLV